MPFGLPLSDSLWSDLIIGRPRSLVPQLSCSEWEWLAQVSDLPNVERDIGDLSVPAVQFAIGSEEFWLSMTRPANFPTDPPIVKCAFQAGFYFDWIDDGPIKSTLSSVVAQYREYCESIGSAIENIKEVAETPEFTLKGFYLDDEESECIVAKFELQLEMLDLETIVVRLDWRRPCEFPREITSSNGTRFSDLDCDSWNDGMTLAFNLRQICAVGSGSDDVDMAE